MNPSESDGDWRYVHITPILSERPHTFTRDCWCKPERDAQNENVLIHSPEQRDAAFAIDQAQQLPC